MEWKSSNYKNLVSVYICYISIFYTIYFSFVLLLCLQRRCYQILLLLLDSIFKINLKVSN